jgi:hypothetical protein
MSISQQALDGLAKAMLGNLQGPDRSSEHRARVVRKDADGTYWVKVPGGAEETPVSSALVEVSPGDSVDVRISNGKAKITGNASNPSASSGTVDKVSGMAMQTMERVDRLDAEAITATSAAFIELNAAAAYIAALVAGSVTAQNIIADHATVQDLDVDTLMATYLKADFTNIDGAHINAADIKELLASSGWFNEVTITGDEAITGQLKSVLIDGDTARLRNLFADSVNILGEDGLYHKLNLMGYDEGMAIVYDEVTPVGTEDPSDEEWYVLDDGAYVPTEDTEVDSGTTYYKRTYDQVDPQGNENPSEEGWYVVEDGKHVASDDEEVDATETYYKPRMAYSNAITKAFWDAYQTADGNSLDNGIHGSNLIAESVTASKIDVTDLTARMLRTQNVVVGAQGGFHIEISGTELGFHQGNTKVAYVSNNELNIPRTVVLDSMRIGDWQWVRQQSGNLTLQWIGTSSS